MANAIVDMSPGLPTSGPGEQNEDRVRCHDAPTRPSNRAYDARWWMTRAATLGANGSFGIATVGTMLTR